MEKEERKGKETRLKERFRRGGRREKGLMKRILNRKAVKWVKRRNRRRRASKRDVGGQRWKGD